MVWLHLVGTEGLATCPRKKPILTSMSLAERLTSMRSSLQPPQYEPMTYSLDEPPRSRKCTIRCLGLGVMVSFMESGVSGRHNLQTLWARGSLRLTLSYLK